MDEVQTPPLSRDMLYDAVQKKKPTAGSLDGWGWREFKDLPAVWFDRLTSILTLVEEDGIWLDGLLDAYTAMIPKTDGRFNTRVAAASMSTPYRISALGLCQVTASSGVF